MAGAVKMQVTVLMAVLVMMVATSTVVTVDARLDFSPILDSFGIQTDSNVTPEDRGGGSACCDLCLCTKSIPPQCRCADIKAYCYKGCKGCACTRSIPPQCRCGDIQNFCYKKCTTTTTTEN